MKEPDHRQRLLSARSERPCSSGAAKRDELASFHSMTFVGAGEQGEHGRGAKRKEIIL
jgi:hypothetical protein